MRELVSAPSANVVAVDSELSWEALAAIPESYATAWTSLIGVLALGRGQTILVRGATSALGQPPSTSPPMPARRSSRQRATFRDCPCWRRSAQEASSLEAPDLSQQVRAHHQGGIDAVLDIVGNTTVIDSLAMLRRGGRACLVGFLGGGGPLSLEPVFQIPSGVYLSVFASALVTGTSAFPLSEIPFQAIVARVAAGAYKAKPARVFRFEEIQDAHRLMESNEAGGKIVIRL